MLLNYCFQTIILLNEFYLNWLLCFLIDAEIRRMEAVFFYSIIDTWIVYLKICMFTSIEPRGGFCEFSIFMNKNNLLLKFTKSRPDCNYLFIFIIFKSFIFSWNLIIFYFEIGFIFFFIIIIIFILFETIFYDKFVWILYKLFFNIIGLFIVSSTIT